jgi:hypothetical protein
MMPAKNDTDKGEDGSGGLSFNDVDEAATFLVRIFGEEAREIAALRAEVSAQKADWRRVGSAVDEVLGGVPPRKRAVRRRFRAFK